MEEMIAKFMKAPDSRGASAKNTSKSVVFIYLTHMIDSSRFKRNRV